MAQLPVSRETLIAFLLDAKRATYASPDSRAKVAPVLPGSQQLEYREGALFYRDIYFGFDFFAGQETVYHDDAPFWSMGYAGGLLDPTIDAVPVYAFLGEALRQVRPERPYRGPEELRKGAYLYTDESHGEVERFWGIETIRYEGRAVYELRYAGGHLLKV
ncbi:MAG: hypothetical protein JXB47_10530 [Anaerolineae bacterium]|nr:hypothetical protein [Anaerolineae bacterium]